VLQQQPASSAAVSILPPKARRASAMSYLPFQAASHLTARSSA
jgi:hypothetical protein